MKPFVELTSWTKIVEILEAKQSTSIVEILKFDGSLTLLLEKAEYLTSKRGVTDTIRRVAHCIRMEVTEEVMHMIFDE